MNTDLPEKNFRACSGLYIRCSGKKHKSVRLGCIHCQKCTPLVCAREANEETGKDPVYCIHPASIAHVLRWFFSEAVRELALRTPCEDGFAGVAAPTQFALTPQFPPPPSTPVPSLNPLLAMQTRAQHADLASHDDSVVGCNNLASVRIEEPAQLEVTISESPAAMPSALPTPWSTIVPVQADIDAADANRRADALGRHDAVAVRNSSDLVRLATSERPSSNINNTVMDLSNQNAVSSAEDK